MSSMRDQITDQSQSFCCYYAECEDGACPIKIDPKVIDGNYIFGQKQFKRNGVQEEHINVPVERRWQA